MTIQMDQAFAWGGPEGQALFKQSNEDFRVDEILPFQPSGEGEHILIQIEKSGHNTAWVSKLLAAAADVPPRQVTYAGLKDRHGVTTQWFGVHLPGKHEPDFSVIEQQEEGIRILQVARHDRKLRTGSLTGNRFQIRLRELNGDRDQLEQRLQHIKTKGVPNYFGPQRFGHEGRNVETALAMFRGEISRKRINRQKRSIYLSAARSWLFNLHLASRIEDNSWNRYQPGDVLMFNDSDTLILPERIDDSAIARAASHELLPTGPMWGRGRPVSQESVAEAEKQLAEGHPDLTSGLEMAGLNQERRALVLMPAAFEWQFEGDDLLLSFSLRRGSYATAVLRELTTLVEPDFRDAADKNNND
ncbi:tRNA pseudouridine(13) synthase TruD [Spongorhabdus nitratireducens]